MMNLQLPARIKDYLFSIQTDSTVCIVVVVVVGWLVPIDGNQR